FALKGPSFNGNAFAAAALEKGCAVAVVDEAEYAADERYVLVDDVLTTLQQLAAYHRRQLDIPVLQITGTNGKTTTKELVSAVLAQKYNVLYTQGNLNNHIGVPLTLLRITREHEMAVIETGANHPGEIAQLCRMVQADYGLVTNVGRAHLEGFGSFEGVKRTKGELYDDLAARGKTVFLNAMDDDLRGMADARSGLRTLNYVEGRVSQVVPFLEVQWRADDDQPWHTVQTRLVGGYNVANARAAATIGLHFGVPAEQIDEALAAYQPTNSRSEFRQTDKNKLIVDAYNANPTSVAAALDSFQFVETEQKMVILGEMRELGEASEREHRAVLQRLLQSDARAIWLVGACFCALAPVEDSRVTFFANVDEVRARLSEQPVTGQTILIKGSNGTKLYQLPAYL
ncbi:MAG: UDP-N-acetylmuramoyl-tripeptide--D-alanyl-D-alanine ligase, partial [Bacteroidaceae bacterium]|nr:UDP-N-acetylmuramoyl-tripeptide--D-alanyl-D-alanine ligase [Bacteroidaceae bacterium]